MIKMLSKQEGLMFDIKSKPQTLNGYQMIEPMVDFGAKRMECKNGKIPLREKILEPAKFNNYSFFYSIGKNSKYDQDDADYAYDQLAIASKTFGIKMV